jgi:arsenate reductase
MKEDGIDISGQTSNLVSEYLDQRFDFIISVCDHARENCPVFPSHAKQLHQTFEDPAGATGSENEIMERFRKVRDQIKDFCRDFVEANILNSNFTNGDNIS